MYIATEAITINYEVFGYVTVTINYEVLLLQNGYRPTGWQYHAKILETRTRPT